VKTATLDLGNVLHLLLWFPPQLLDLLSVTSLFLRAPSSWVGMTTKKNREEKLILLPGLKLGL
jgi:hypothetical protein